MHWERPRPNCVMITLIESLDISGFFVDGSIDEMRQFCDRMKGCYQVVINPFEPHLIKELAESFTEDAGPELEVDTSEVFTGKGELILETVIKPYTTDFRNEDSLSVGTSIKVTVLPELKYSSDHSSAFTQLTIARVEKYYSPGAEINWDNMPDNGCDFSFLFDMSFPANYLYTKEINRIQR